MLEAATTLRSTISFDVACKSAKTFAGLFGNQRDAVAGVNGDHAADPGISRQRDIAGVVGGAVERLGALIGRGEKRVVEAGS